ncbi:MAG: hypothetical protein WC304_02045 [Candidatus Gracilibacteria bacterium]|jgi:hypothetical protein
MDPKLVFQQIRQMKLTQDDLRADIFEVKGKGIRVVVNGEMKFLEVNLPAKITPAVAKELISVLNKTVKKVQSNSLDKFKKLVN